MSENLRCSCSLYYSIRAIACRGFRRHKPAESYFTPISLSRRSALPHLSMRKSM